MINPMMARPRGMPTAQPMIRPRFELEPPSASAPDVPFVSPLAAPSVPLPVEVGVGVITLVIGTLTTPVDPVERLIETEVKGVPVGAASSVAVASLEAPDDDEPEPEDDAAFVDCGAEVFDAEELSSSSSELLPLARPVNLARFGAVEAVMEPIVAYAAPSCRAKKGRGSGDSWQQSTCVASALQHHLSS